MFFDVGIKSVRKHFDIWRRENLSYALVSSEPEIIDLLANWMVKSERPSSGSTYNASKTHGDSSGRDSVDLNSVYNYLTELSTQDQLAANPLARENVRAIKKIADASNGTIDVWKSQDSDMVELCIFGKVWVIPHATSTHRTEGLIREASHCASTGRSEEMRTAAVVQRSVGNSEVNRIVQEQAQTRILRGNQHMSSGKRGARTHVSETSRKKHKTEVENTDSVLQIHARGEMRGRVLLENTQDRFIAVGGSKNSAERANLKLLFKSPDQKASGSRAEVKLEEFWVSSQVNRAPSKQDPTRTRC